MTRPINDVMKKQINNDAVYTRIDAMIIDDVLTRYEVVARCTVYNPQNAQQSIDLFLYFGTDYYAIALVINGKQRTQNTFSHDQLLNAYAFFTRVINGYNWHKHVNFDGIFLAVIDATINGQ